MSRDELLSCARAAFESRFGAAPTWFGAAPGRVNLIGEHLDYNGGVVAPFAIDRWTVVAARTNDERIWRVWSDQDPDAAAFAIEPPITPGPPAWANLVRGVVARAQDRAAAIPGMDACVVSNLPVGAGLSSSAALAVAFTALLDAVADLGLTLHDRARLAQRAEHDFAGTPCGLMDQLASAGGREGEVMTIDFGAGEAVTYEPFPADLAVVIADTGVRRALNDGRYGARRAECEAAAGAIGLATLGEASPAAVEAAGLDPILHRRARHVVTEIERVRRAMAALRAGDARTCGAMMDASHDSLRDDFEVSGPELEALVAAARRIGPDGGVYGSRLTGAGFGGCTVTLVDAHAAGAVARAIAADAAATIGRSVRTMSTRPQDGVRVERADSSGDGRSSRQ